MVLFSITAQILDTLILKTASFTIESAFSLISWSVKSIYSIYVPSKLSETELLQLEVSQLRKTINILEHNYISEISNNDNSTYYIIDSESNN